MGLKPKKPKMPDPTKTSDAQLGYNQQAAHQTININALDRSGPFGSTTFQRDDKGNVIGQTAALSPELQGAAGGITSNLGLLTNYLPSAPINWDQTTAPTIAQNNIDAYMASTLPMRQQRQKQLDVQLAERGIPIGSEIYNDAQGNLDRANSVADVNAVAQAWNAVPGMQQQLTNNLIAQYDQPYSAISNNLGLLQGLQNFTGYAPQAAASVGAPNYADLVMNKYNQQMANYNSDMTGLGSLVSKGIGLLAAPYTGGASLWL